MSNNIQIYSSEVISADVDVKNIKGHGTSRIPYLNVPVDLRYYPIKKQNESNEDYCINTITGELSLNNQNLTLSNTQLNRPSNTRIKSSWKQNRNFVFPLSREILTEIEDVRVKDLELRLQLYFCLSQFKDDVLNNYSNDQINLDFKIPQSQWVDEILPIIGFQEYFLIEIPKGRKTISRVWELLEAAEVSFGQLDFIALFAKCREIGTLLNSSLKDELGSKSFSYKIRWGRSYEKFNYYSSYPLHLEDFKKGDQSYTVEEIKVNKIDAEQLMLRTKSLLKYAEQLLLEKSSDRN